MRKKIISVFLFGIFVILGVLYLAGCATSVTANAPDYSESNKKLNMFSYFAPYEGEYYIKNEKQPDVVNQRTKENYQMYKDIGYDILLLDGDNPYPERDGKPYEESLLKKQLDWASEIGLKVIVYDSRVFNLTVKTEGSLLGTPRTVNGIAVNFAKFEDLVEYVRGCMEDYMYHPAFIGMTLYDEPEYKYLQAYGEIYRAIKAVKEDALVHAELSYMNPWLPESYFTGKNNGGSLRKNYEIFIEKFLNEAQTDYLDYDHYPLQRDENTGENMISSTYITTLQIVIKSIYARNKNSGFTLTISSAGEACPGKVSIRNNTREDLRWQGNMGLAFGAKNISYYTYYPFPYKSPGENYSTQSAVKMDGTKDLYDEIQAVNKEFQALAKVILNYRYEGSGYFTGERKVFPTKMIGIEEYYMADGSENGFECIEEVKTDSETIINQMYDEERGSYGYMVLNVTDPGDGIGVKAEVTFDKKYKNVMVINKGQTNYYKLKKSVYTAELEAGDSCFVIPY